MKVLLVEDSAADARLVLELLADAHASSVNLVHASGLSAALERLASETFDAVLLDLGLPDARGLDALEPVLAAAPEVPVVVLSGQRDERLAVEAVQHGAQDYLLKGQGDGHLLARALRYAIERKRGELHVQHLANHDGLTGLPNRRLLLDRLGQAIARSRRGQRMLALVFFDLDRFKEVNDTCGHAAGDELLQAVAGRLAGAVRECDTVARLGGDEFTVVLPEVVDVADVERFAAKIFDLFRAPFLIAGREQVMTASLGIGLYPRDGQTAEELLRVADAAMYGAKKHGGDRFHYHSDEAPRPRRTPDLGGALRRAIEGDELELYYQPRVEGATGRIVGAEALLRWRHPELGLLAPARFLPLAAELALLVPLGDRVLRDACAQARAWRVAHPELDLGIAVNVSGLELGRRDLRARVRRALAQSGLEPGALELQLTENGLARNDSDADGALGRLRAEGVRIAIDDFGTGYSSLDRLRRFPISALLIDRRFVARAPHRAADGAIVSAIVTMAHGMGLDAIAEGVESAAQVDFLRAHDCDEMQGFHFGPPMPAAELETRLRFAAAGGPPAATRRAHV